MKKNLICYINMFDALHDVYWWNAEQTHFTPDMHHWLGGFQADILPDKLSDLVEEYKPEILVINGNENYLKRFLKSIKEKLNDKTTIIIGDIL